ncbi:hypothetical protein LV779_25545 [Streptomyces thinghirensis]|nr:hypothetical protein [Streptomyces thinghirensis]
MLATGAVATRSALVHAPSSSGRTGPLALWLLIVPAFYLATGTVTVTVSPSGVTAAASTFLPLLRRRLPSSRIEERRSTVDPTHRDRRIGLPLEPRSPAPVSLREGDALSGSPAS